MANLRIIGLVVNLALVAIAMPTTSSSSSSSTTTTPATLSVLLHPDAHCNVLASNYASSLAAGACTPATAGFQSLEIYAQPSQGRLAVYEADNCTEHQGGMASVSTEFLGCDGGFGFVARSVMWVPVA